jgi:hypothetical protein
VVAEQLRCARGGRGSADGEGRGAKWLICTVLLYHELIELARKIGGECNSRFGNRTRMATKRRATLCRIERILLSQALTVCAGVRNHD